jgi:hypothetical protein
MDTQQRMRDWISIEILVIFLLVSLACGTSAIPASKVVPDPTDTSSPTKVPTQTRTPLAISETGLLPGLQPADVKFNLQNRQFNCELAFMPTDTDPYSSWECQRKNAQYYMSVEIWSKSLDSVDLIVSSVVQFRKADDGLATDFLGFMATMPFDGAEPQEARTWVGETLPTITANGDVREATFGGIKFRLYGIPTARFLDIGEDLPLP